MTDRSDALHTTSTESLEHEVVTLAAQIAQATCRFLLVVAELDRRQAWAQWDGVRSMAHWLSWRCSLSLSTAREHVRVARALPSLPTTAAAFDRGELSYSKVRALSRVATTESDADLAEQAKTMTAWQLDRTVRASTVAMATGSASEASGALRVTVSEDGLGRVHGRIPVDAVAIIERALAEAMPLVDDASADASSAAERRAQALVRICESYLAHGDAAREASVRNEAVVHVSLDESGVTDAMTSTGEPIAAEAAKRLLCDCRVQGMLSDVTGPIGVGRRTRTIRRQLRRALQKRSGGRCEWVGCDEQVYVEAHHIQAWVEGGVTELHNLALLCWHHHHLVHEGGWRIERSAEDGRTRCYRPDGTEIDVAPPRVAMVPPLPDVDDERIVPGWRGEPLDLAAAVDVFISKRTPAA